MEITRRSLKWGAVSFMELVFNEIAKLPKSGFVVQNSLVSKLLDVKSDLSLG